MRASGAEEYLRGKAPEDKAIQAAAKAAQAAATPIDDQRASADYRKMMVNVLTQKVLHRAVETANNSQ
jgi:carbon-monoxide dehydrogenase medium subunit